MKVEMMRGLPASGKTTAARRRVIEDGNSGRINRDDLRAMLFNSVWSGKREQVIIDCEKAIAGVLFSAKMNAIVDDTNLSQRHRDMWSHVAIEAGNKFEVTSLLDVPIEECRHRDDLRKGSVGRAVIDRMALQNGLIDWGDRSIVLCDIDGTLADGRHREHFVQGKKDWTSYYALLRHDEPIDIVVRWVRELAKDHLVCLVSGRPDTYQRETMSWLNEYCIPYDWLFMRSGGDKRPDTMVKNDILRHIPKEKIAFAIDDRPSVIREVWRANGVRVFPVRGACEEF